jgi:hypothetical protein
MSLVQGELQFDRRSVAPPKALIVLSNLDKQYLDECVRTDRSFSESFLAQTRCQRIGCTMSELYAMRNYERSLHLADEAVILRYESWNTTPAMYLDWSTINKRAVQAAEQLGQDFAEWRANRHRTKTSVLKKTKGL